MKQYPAWKYLLLVVVLAVSLLYALPNLFGEDPAIQVSATRGAVVDSALASRIASRLQEESVSLVKDPEVTGGRLLIRFADEDGQLAAQDLIKEMLGRQYVVALNLAPATPDWLAAVGALPMYLGLDLRGGVHFLMEVDMDAAVSQAEERYLGDIKGLLRKEKLRYQRATRPEGESILLRFKDAALSDKAYSVIRAEYPELDVEQSQSSEGFDVRAKLSEAAAIETREFALDQNITTLRSRVNELGVAEPLIQQQGVDRIVVQLPGVQDTTTAKIILGGTATLEFRMLHQTGDMQAALDGRVPIGAKLYQDRQGQPVLLKRDVMLTGEYITDAASGIDQQSGTPAVFITLDGQGARIFSKATRDEIGNPMGVVFIEHKTDFQIVNGERIKEDIRTEEVINIATIRDQLSKRFQITGLDTTEEARNLALLLRAGALAAPIAIVEERTVGPSLGQENIDQGFRSVVIAFVAVLIFMAIYYRTFGLVANLALAFNLVLIVSVLSLLQATLTLPGIAGIVLTVGMAVDANVLIFERIREEIRNGNTPQASIHAGYEKALSTIADANVTTLIAAVVLFGFGTGPVKGFAITLSIGIISSMFTAIMGTRGVVNLIYGGRRVKALSI